VHAQRHAYLLHSSLSFAFTLPRLHPLLVPHHTFVHVSAHRPAMCWATRFAITLLRPRGGGAAPDQVPRSAPPLALASARPAAPASPASRHAPPSPPASPRALCSRFACRAARRRRRWAVAGGITGAGGARVLLGRGRRSPARRRGPRSFRATSVTPRSPPAPAPRRRRTPPRPHAPAPAPALALPWRE